MDVKFRQSSYNSNNIVSRTSLDNRNFERFTKENSGCKPENYFLSTKQKYIPLYSLEPHSAHFNFTNGDSSRRILSTKYYKPDIQYSSYASKNLKDLLSVFTGLRLQDRGRAVKMIFQYNNEDLIIYIGPGILMDAQGKVLCATVVNKGIFDYINSFKEEEKLEHNLFKIYDAIEQKNILNIFSYLMVTKEFYTNRKYKNMLNLLVSNLSDSENYKLDLIITDNIESKIFNVGEKVTKSYGSIQDKVAYQKEVWRKVLI